MGTATLGGAAYEDDNSKKIGRWLDWPLPIRTDPENINAQAPPSLDQIRRSTEHTIGITAIQLNRFPHLN